MLGRLPGGFHIQKDRQSQSRRKRAAAGRRRPPGPQGVPPWNYHRQQEYGYKKHNPYSFASEEKLTMVLWPTTDLRPDHDLAIAMCSDFSSRSERSCYVRDPGQPGTVCTSDWHGRRDVLRGRAGRSRRRAAPLQVSPREMAAPFHLADPGELRSENRLMGEKAIQAYEWLQGMITVEHLEKGTFHTHSLLETCLSTEYKVLAVIIIGDKTKPSRRNTVVNEGTVPKNSSGRRH
ncbi:hypothetical protein J6590_016890 [Homalodisca vitripennis]|nr:hypothetical protein J6590_016890 [Homalodisca vitripennis]